MGHGLLGANTVQIGNVFHLGIAISFFFFEIAIALSWHLAFVADCSFFFEIEEIARVLICFGT